MQHLSGNTHVLYHALCDEDVPELELSNSLNVVLQALEKVTSKGRGLEWMVPYVNRIFSATHVERLATALETLWKWYAPLMRKKQKIGRPLLPHIWTMIRSMSQHPHLRGTSSFFYVLSFSTLSLTQTNKQTTHRPSKPRKSRSVSMLCDEDRRSVLRERVTMAAPSGAKPEAMPMITRSRWFIQPLRMIRS